MMLDSIPQLEINKEIERMIEKYKPEIVFTSPKNDLNMDHQVTFNSTLVATRPNSSGVKQVFSYELPGFVKEPFLANYFEDITKEFSYKIRAFKNYKSEIRKFPHPRSPENMKYVAGRWGSVSGFKAAEAFELIRRIDK